MLKATKKIARACQSSLISSLGRIIGYLDGGQTDRHRAPLVSANSPDRRSDQSAGERSFATKSSRPHLSLAFVDADKPVALSMEKLSPLVLKDLHAAMDDLASDSLTDSTD